MSELFNSNFFSDGLPWGIVAIIVMAIVFGFLIPRYLYRVVVSQNSKLIETFERIGPTLETIAKNQDLIIRMNAANSEVFNRIPVGNQPAPPPLRNDNEPF